MSQFPSNPNFNDRIVIGGITYTWDGAKWVVTKAPFNTGATGATGAGYGVYAWARVDGLANVAVSNNISGVSRPTNGVYNYTFIDSFVGPANYTVVVTNNRDTGISPDDIDFTVRNITPTGFQVYAYRNAGGGTPTNCDHSVQVVGAGGPSATSSAYEVWLAAGNVGNQDAFLQYLVGPSGATGPRGATGASGPQGITGATGVKGEDGQSIKFSGAVTNENDLATLPPLGAGDENSLYIVLNGPTGPNNKFDAGDGAIWNGGNSTLPDLSAWDNVGKIRGPEGPDGPLGSTGATGPQGVQGVPGADTGGFFVLTGERNGRPNAGQFFAFGNGGNNPDVGSLFAEPCQLNKISFTTRNPWNGTGSSMIVEGIIYRYNSGSNTYTKINTGVFAESRANSNGSNFTFGPSPITNINENDYFQWECIQQCTQNIGATVVSASFGSAGIRGATGVAGPPGPSGGATGVQGVQGATGPQGPTGIQGATGPIGLTGLSGATGPQGPQGIQGGPGVAGPTGTAVKARVADLTELFLSSNGQTPPGLSASGDGTIVTDDGSGTADVIYAWNGGTSGSASDWVEVGDIQGPQGIEGPQGATGPQGGLASVYGKFRLRSDNSINDTPLRQFRIKDVFDGSTPPDAEFFISNGTSGNTFQFADGLTGSNDKSGVTVPESGLYMISATCYYTATDDRVSVGIRFGLSNDDTVTGTEQPEIGAMGYIRLSNNHNTSSVTVNGIYNLIGGTTVVQLLFARMGDVGAADATLEIDGSAVSIVKIGD